jgi:putative transposase
MEDLLLELEMRGYSKASDAIERFKLDLSNHRAFPRDHWKKIRTTNGSERINKELKRRTRVVGTFPNDESFMRLAVSILMDVNEEWLTGRKYLTMDVK